jgi:DNA polymerase-3 subunit beta
MRLDVIQESIKRALSVVAPAVASKSQLPVLSHVQLTADDNGVLWLAATNLEVGIKVRSSARVEQAGSVCIPHKLFSDLIGGLPNVPISLALDERTQTLTVKAGKFKTEIKGIESDEFPVLPVSSTDPQFSMIGSDWHMVADRVAMCAATDQTRPVLAGVHVFANNGVVFEACDQHRLARKRFDIDVDGVDTIIPATALIMARKVFAADADVSFTLATSGALILLQSETTTFTARVIEGKYPDCDRIIPTTYTSRIVVPVAELSTRLNLAKFVAVTSSNIVRLALTVLEDRDGKVGISANAAEVATLDDALDVIASGKDVTIALNINYLLQAVGACGAGDLVVELQDSTRPAVLRAAGDESMLQLCMPMTIR